MVFLTVVVPIYNSKKYLRECIDSIIYQSFKNIEIILIDDGSTDGSGYICDEYRKIDHRINVVHKENEGVAAARNDGLRIAHGEYVIFCDSDDKMGSESCDAFFQASMKYPKADVLIGDVFIVRESKTKRVSFFDKPFYTENRERLNELILTDFSRKYCPCPAKNGPAFGYGGPWNKAVKTDFLRRNGILFEKSLNGVFDDILYTAYLYSYATAVAYIQVPVYTYRELQTSLTHSYKSNALATNKAIFSAWEEFISKQDEPEYFTVGYYVVVVRRLKGTIGLYFFNKKNQKPRHEQIRELKQVITGEPYATAVRNVELNRLPFSYDVAVCVAARLNWAGGLLLVYMIRNGINAIRRR